MTRATWKGKVLAESDDVVVVDGYHYFPRDSIDADVLLPSDRTSVCPWKGKARYHTIAVDGAENRDAAWYYPDPSPAAAHVAGRVAFWRGVKISTGVDDDPGASRPGLLARIRQRFASATTTPPADRTDPPQPQGESESAVGSLDDATFAAGVEGHWTLVDFWAQWCGPCRSFHPTFEKAAREHIGDLRFARCDVDASPDTASALQVLSIPTVVLFDPSGNEVERVVGVPSRRALRRLIDRGSVATTTASGGVPA